ncbi:MAG: DUF2520 domain-containing protein [Thermoanaerobacterales bacterium]|nr:DUF2520 domain-containing protein [Thermoanaerobacterales bacterium]
MTAEPSMAIIGAGRAGTALGLALAAAGYPVAAVASRRLETAEALARRVGCPATDRPDDAARRAAVVWITTPDRAVAEVAGAIAAQGGFSPGQHVFHASGALPAAVLSPAREKGALVAAVHPLQSFAGVTGPPDLAGCYFGVEGDAAALPLARRLVADLGGVFLPLRAGDKALYHAAACVASNYLVSVLDLAVRLLEGAGLERKAATAALLPLVEGTVANVRRAGVAAALTGPVARGDLDTVRGHVEALRALDPEAAELYRLLGCYTAGLARARGDLAPAAAAALELILKGV